MKRGILLLAIVTIHLAAPVAGAAQGQGNNRITLSGDEFLTINTLYDGTTVEGQSTTISWRNNRVFTIIRAYLDAPSPIAVTLRAENFQGDGLPIFDTIILEPNRSQAFLLQLFDGEGQATLHYTLDVPEFMAPGTYPITVNFELTRN